MNIDMIRAAAARIKGHARKTPLLTSPFVDEIAGRRVLLKCEALQHTGSFKFRGGWSAVSALENVDGVLAYSSGNHAQGVAAAAKAHGLPAVIIMPKDAPALKIANTKALGAEVVLYDRNSESREDIGNALAAERGLHLIKPYDDAYVIAGQGTAGLEIAEQAAAEGVTDGDVLVCCGGAGLTSGIALALEAEAPGLRVRPVEPSGFDDVARSIQSGQRETNTTRPSDSICDAIVTPSPGELTFPILQRLSGPGIVVPDEDCMRAMVVAWQRLKVVLEPGGAIALAAALYHGDHIEGDAVIAVASGGNVDQPMFERALKEYSQ